MTNQSSYGERLLSTLRDDIRRSLRSLAAAHPGEKIIGYGLCTDDGTTTVSHVAMTDAQLASARREIRFNPNDWCSTERETDLDPSYEVLAEHLTEARANDTFSSHVEESFAAMVEALRGARAEGAFASECFVLAYSSDPSERMLEREREAIARLNPPSLVADYGNAR